MVPCSKRSTKKEHFICRLIHHACKRVTWKIPQDQEIAVGLLVGIRHILICAQVTRLKAINLHAHVRASAR